MVFGMDRMFEFMKEQREICLDIVRNFMFNGNNTIFIKSNEEVSLVPKSDKGIVSILMFNSNISVKEGDKINIKCSIGNTAKTIYEGWCNKDVNCFKTKIYFKTPISKNDKIKICGIYINDTLNTTDKCNIVAEVIDCLYGAEKMLVKYV